MPQAPDRWTPTITGTPCRLAPLRAGARATPAGRGRGATLAPPGRPSLRRRRLLLGLAWLALLIGQRPSVAQEAEPNRSIEFLSRHCLRCHGPERAEGGLNVRDLPESLETEAQLQRWSQILQRVEDEEMPPAEAPQPTATARAAFVTGLVSRLEQLSESGEGPPRPAGARRLTNVEYENTIRDLLGFRLKLIEDLPKDPIKPYRFNNTAEFMRLGPEQFNHYLTLARRAMRSAIVDPTPPEVHRTRREWTASGIDRGLGGDELGIWGNRRNTPAEGMPLKSFPRSGEYRIRIKASAILPAGVQEMPLRLVMGYGGLNENQSTYQIEPVGTVRLSHSPDQPAVYEFRGRIENHPIRPGKTQKGRRLPESMAITPQNLYDDGTLNDDNDFSRTRNIAMPRAVIEWIEFEAPLTEDWPPAHHRAILFESPLRESDPAAYTRQVIQRFMDRAYRRPATPEEVNRMVQVHDLVSPQFSTLEESLRETLAMVLVSPQFLLQTTPGEATSRQHALASRLSYFLWASMPDETLLELAAQEELDDPEILEQQVQRLLEDPRAQDFIRQFTLQWLSLGKMKTVPINQELFPRFLYYVPRGERAGTEEPYRPTIRDYMLEETVGFVAELIGTNAPALSVVDSDFAWLNQPLAAHYGIEGVEGIHFRRVPLKPESRLGGLLTQGSVLVGNGTGSAPHPIYRAVWLREAILGDEVPPPPAEVPALADSAGESAEKALSIKDLLRKHRQQESCHACHASLDPWGIPFEQYNAIGRYQPRVPADGTRVQSFNSRQHGDLAGYRAYLQSINTVAVDAAAELPSGDSVDGMSGLKQYLLQHRREDIAENLARRLLAYGLGRRLDVRDRKTVAQILDATRQHDHRIRDMIVAICQSRAFRDPP